MLLKRIEILNFKNISRININFSPNINCLVGKNGSGKTNILDAIHYLCLTKGFFGLPDLMSVKYEQPFFRIVGEWKVKEETNLTECAYSVGSKKIFKVSGLEYDKLSEHIGKFPIVIIAPDDTDLIRDGSEVRRKFFDSIICQLNEKYLKELITYNYILKQRNILLKKTAISGYSDRSLIEVYDVQLYALGTLIFNIRKEFLNNFIPIFKKCFQNISSDSEIPNLKYHSDLEKDTFNQLYTDTFEKDIMLQRTTKGIHTDEFEFLIDDKSVKKTASQGQKKSYVIALKLSQFECIVERKNLKPLLLMDDIFDKLDDERIKKIIEMIANNSFGQIFVTDARPERSKELFGQFDDIVNFYSISEGNLRNNIQ